MSKRLPILSIDPQRITGNRAPKDMRETQAALAYHYLFPAKENGIYFSDLEQIFRRENELNRPELKAAVDCLLTLKLARTKVIAGRVKVYAKTL